FANWINRAAIHSATAGVAPRLGTFGRRSRSFGSCYPAPLFSALCILKIEGHNLFRREANCERCLRAIDCRWDGFQLQWQTAVEKQTDSLHAAIVRARDSGQRLVGLARGTIKGDFDGKRTPVGEVIRDALVDHRAVREERDQKPAFFRFGIDGKEILASEDFAARIKEP